MLTSVGGSPAISLHSQPVRRRSTVTHCLVCPSVICDSEVVGVVASCNCKKLAAHHEAVPTATSIRRSSHGRRVCASSHGASSRVD